MNAVFSPLVKRLLAVSLLVLCCWSLAAPVGAAESAAAGHSSFTTLQANAFLQLLGDRSRMIQASLVFVLLGCSMLWWKR